MALRVLALSAILSGAAANSLSDANWDAETAGKQILVKFQAPW